MGEPLGACRVVDNTTERKSRVRTGPHPQNPAFCLCHRDLCARKKGVKVPISYLLLSTDVCLLQGGKAALWWHFSFSHVFCPISEPNLFRLSWEFSPVGGRSVRVGQRGRFAGRRAGRLARFVLLPLLVRVCRLDAASMNIRGYLAAALQIQGAPTYARGGGAHTRQQHGARSG